MTEIQRLEAALARKAKQVKKNEERNRDYEKKYSWLVPGSVRAATEEEQERLSKSVVGLVECQIDGCGTVTLRAAQDFFHAEFCPEHRKEQKSNRTKVQRPEDKMSPKEIQARLEVLRKEFKIANKKKDKQDKQDKQVAA